MSGKSIAVIGGVPNVRNCYNFGRIIAKTENNTQNGGTYIGGISDGAININNCYNIGTIDCDNKINHVGGIDANAQNASIIDCHNIGNLIVEGESRYYGSLVGTGRNLTINNSKWLLNTAPSSVGDNLGEVTDNSECINTLEEMPSVLEIINGDGAFKEDSNNINNGYPILSWQ